MNRKSLQGDQILNRAQQRFADLQESINTATKERNEVQASADQLKLNITKLELLLAQDESNIRDLDVAIRSDQNALDSLIRDKVTLPNLTIEHQTEEQTDDASGQ